MAQHSHRTYPFGAIIEGKREQPLRPASFQMEQLVDTFEQLKVDALEKRFELTAELQDIQEQLAQLNEMIKEMGVIV